MPKLATNRAVSAEALKDHDCSHCGATAGSVCTSATGKPAAHIARETEYLETITQEQYVTRHIRKADER
jgi:hypothetical protein